jgi:hypothetical protein
MARLMLESFSKQGIAPPLHPGGPVRLRGVAVASSEAEILLDILRSHTNLAIWGRDLPEGFTASLKPLAAAAPFSAVVEDTPEAAVDLLATRLPHPAPLDLLIDIRRLAMTFAVLADCGGPVRIRLEAITGPACHRWHADAVGLRLLCSYWGPGTEWLPLVGGAPVARGLKADALPCEASQIATGAVAVLKGEGFPGNAGFGCIHRSPPAGPGERARLLLCIDEPGRIPLE